jgi:hypothetical protein
MKQRRRWWFLREQTGLIIEEPNKAVDDGRHHYAPNKLFHVTFVGDISWY